MSQPVNMATIPASDMVIYREVQPYRELPPVMLLAAVSGIAGWGLLIWTVLLGRPLGALELPTWLGIVLGLGFGLVLPVIFLWMRMTTEVYPDRVSVDTGMTGRHNFAYADIADVELRTADLREDYSNRNVGTKENTRVAYAVNTLQGAQLILRDGRFILIGSKKPEELTEAIDSAWQVATIST